MEKKNTMSLTQFCMDHINSDPQLSKLQKKQSFSSIRLYSIWC